MLRRSLRLGLVANNGDTSDGVDITWCDRQWSGRVKWKRDRGRWILLWV